MWSGCLAWQQLCLVTNKSCSSKNWAAGFCNIRQRLTNLSQHHTHPQLTLKTTCKRNALILWYNIITFLSTIFILLCGQTIRNCWETLSEDQKEAIAENVQGIFKVMKKELKLENQPPQMISKGIPQK